MTPLLEVRDLRMWFHTDAGVVTAVDGVSFSVEPGEVFGIVGESGSGKSVTAMTILGLIPMPPGRVESGEILWKGENLLAMSDERLRKVRGKEISMIFQDPMTSLNPVYTPRPADRRDRARAQRRHASARRTTAPWTCSSSSASRTRSSAPTTTRISSPAGCASGR